MKVTYPPQNLKIEARFGGSPTSGTLGTGMYGAYGGRVTGFADKTSSFLEDAVLYK